MSDIVSAIQHDMDEYMSLCEKYKEKPRYTPDGNGFDLLDCYGKHASKLIERNSEERAAQYKNGV